MFKPGVGCADSYSVSTAMFFADCSSPATIFNVYPLGGLRRGPDLPDRLDAKGARIATKEGRLANQSSKADPVLSIIIHG